MYMCTYVCIYTYIYIYIYMRSFIINPLHVNLQALHGSSLGISGVVSDGRPDLKILVLKLRFMSLVLLVEYFRVSGLRSPLFCLLSLGVGGVARGLLEFASTPNPKQKKQVAPFWVNHDPSTKQATT